MGQNVNGLSYYNDYVEWEMALLYMDEFQVDVECLGEPNLDLKKPEVMEQIYKRLKKIDMHSKLIKSVSPSIFSDTPFQMGGTITYTRGNWAGHIHEQGSERLGRWSYQTFEGREGRKVTIINVYRVGKATGDSGSCTIRSQQAKDLLVDKNEHLNPWEEILIELQRNINKLHGEGHMVILYGDMNDNIQQSS